MPRIKLYSYDSTAMHPAPPPTRDALGVADDGARHKRSTYRCRQHPLRGTLAGSGARRAARGMARSGDAALHPASAGW